MFEVREKVVILSIKKILNFPKTGDEFCLSVEKNKN